jgi:O6-methylguanine-DNA--protein-cysteine methyltransferase
MADVTEVEAREALETARRLVPSVKARGKHADPDERALLDRSLWTASRGRWFTYDEIAGAVGLSRAAVGQAIGRASAAQAALA